MWMTSDIGREVLEINVYPEGYFSTFDLRGEEIIWGWFNGIVSLE